MKKSNLLIIMSSILLLSGITGCLDNNDKKDTLESGYNISYTVEIITDNTEYYTLKIPYPENWNNIRNDINVSNNNPKIFTEKTIHGNALVIKGEGNVIISANKEFEEKIENFSMMEYDGKKSIYIFCEKNQSKNISINLDFNGNPKNKNEFGYGYYLEKTSLDNGWQIIQLENREV